jgi:biopolymer transport protein ExbB
VLEQQILNFALLGAGWVLWLLVGLSVLSLAVAVERVVYGLRNQSHKAGLNQALEGYRSGGSLDELLRQLQRLPGVESRVLQAAAKAAQRGGAPAAEEELSGHFAFEQAAMERGLIILGSIGSNAPFIGLFGTVLGIIQAFHDLSLDSADGAAAVMAGISEALVATAVGLLVAIPAVVLFNWFNRRNKDTLGRLGGLSRLFLSRLKEGAVPAGH